MSNVRPRPVPDALSAPYWKAAARGSLALPRCSACGHYALPPGVVCGHCQSASPAFRYEEVAPEGRVRSWTVLHDSFLPGFADLLPLVLVDVELDVQADLRMIGRLLEGLEPKLGQGDRVLVAFEELAPGVAVPAFTRPPTRRAPA